MKYDFDEVVNRYHTNALNTDGFRGYIFHDFEGKKKFPFKDDEFVRMWVADMEFAMCPDIIQAIKDRADKRIIGYSQVFEPDFYQVYNAWNQKMYGWTYPKEQICFSLGIIPALYELVDLLLSDHEYAIVNTPAYGYFQHPIDYKHKHAIHNKLVRDAEGNWHLDFDALERDAANPFAKLLIWCNPQNPTGHVWSEEELKKVADIVERHNLWIISDEIHCDLLRQGVKHIPMAKIMPDYDKLIVCTSASKAFNMAGMMFAEIIIRDPQLRKLYIASTDTYAMNLNPLSIAAHTAAYEKGGEWLDQLRTYLDGNFRLVKDTFARELPRIVFQIPEATYLPGLGGYETLSGRCGKYPGFHGQQGRGTAGRRRFPVCGQRQWIHPAEPSHAPSYGAERLGTDRQSGERTRRSSVKLAATGRKAGTPFPSFRSLPFSGAASFFHCLHDFILPS